jgi:hypothetical protein
MWLLSYVSCFYMQVMQETGGHVLHHKNVTRWKRLDGTCNVMEDSPGRLLGLSYQYIGRASLNWVRG